MRYKRRIRAVILAAGKGMRMKRKTPKLLIVIEGKPIIGRVVDACTLPEIEKIYVVVGHRAKEIRDAAGAHCTFVEQKEQLGTAHALMQVRPRLRDYRGDLVGIVGDSPFLTPRLVRRLVRIHQREGAAATCLTTRYPEPPPYARVIRDNKGRVTNVIEENRCTPEQKEIKEVFTSHYCFRSELVLPLLSEIGRDNPKGEYYLTDIISILIRHGYSIRAVCVKNPLLVFGINDVRDLRWALKKT